MLNFLKRNKSEPNDKVEPLAESSLAEPSMVMPRQKSGLLGKLRSSLQRTRSQLGEGVARIFLGKKQIDAELLEELEMQLLLADIGVETTQLLIKDLTAQVNRKQLNDPASLFNALQQHLIQLLKPVSIPLQIPAEQKTWVILMVGVNGAGKTTTIGKLAKKLQSQGKKIMLAAGDTFRAAAVEQLQVWGERNQIPVIAQHSGADSASVVYDALAAAKARQVDVLIADTAGRLHTQENLMNELKKVKRVLGKLDETAPHEVLLVLDASIGQNALAQAKQFHQAVGVTGIAITKLDGTAKGGMVFSIASQLQLPIRFIGVGEGIEDLREFNAEEFVKALFED